MTPSKKRIRIIVILISFGEIAKAVAESFTVGDVEPHFGNIPPL